MLSSFASWLKAVCRPSATLLSTGSVEAAEHRGCLPACEVSAACQDVVVAHSGVPATMGLTRLCSWAKAATKICTALGRLVCRELSQAHGGSLEPISLLRRSLRGLHETPMLVRRRSTSRCNLLLDLQSLVVILHGLVIGLQALLLGISRIIAIFFRA